MKKSELKQLIREEISKILKESNLDNIPNDNSLKKDIENLFGLDILPHYNFKFDKVNNLVGVNIDYLSDDTRIDPNKLTSIIRGLVRKNSAKYSEIKPESGGGWWTDKYLRMYPSLDEMDPDIYMAIKIK